MTLPKREITLRRLWFYAMVSSFIVLIVALPIGVYWYAQVIDTHTRWDTESTYAHEFYLETSDVAYQMRGNFGPWDNVSRFYGGEKIANAEFMLFNLENLDTAHRTQLTNMSSAIGNFRESSGAFCGLPTYCQNITVSQKTSWSNQLLTLATKVYNAYNNYGNYTTTTPGVGPPFWYSGPSPPDERDLRDAVMIATNLMK